MIYQIASMNTKLMWDELAPLWSLHVVFLTCVIDVAKRHSPLINYIFNLDDPCTKNSELPRAGYRGGQCDMTYGKETCDAALKYGWYRAVGVNNIDLEIQTTVAGFASCGTKFPYWMNGKLSIHWIVVFLFLLILKQEVFLICIMK